MNRLIFLDAGPLGLLAAPAGKKGQTGACASWLRTMLVGGNRLIVPEIADYEVRRELLRLKKKRIIERLDALCSELHYLPLTTIAMRRAAEFWAETRQKGQPTAADHAIDADAILAAQCMTFATEPSVVATTNISHLSRFVAAQKWQDILA